MIGKLKKYINELLGISATIQPFQEQKKLPFFLRETYSFFEMFIENQSRILMIEQKNQELTPNTIKKNLDQVTKKWNIPCVYIANTISSYTRRRLVEEHISFIIPNNQMYVPDLGIYLCEHFKKQRNHKLLFSPATQSVIIWTLLQEKMERITPSELAAALSYSPMTMSRALNELETEGIGKLDYLGRERYWIFEDTKKDLWEQTKDMLRSPIKSCVPMKKWPGLNMPQLPLSGISALAETTMINPPKIPVYAIGLEEFRQDTPKGFAHGSIDEADFLLEIWYYNPNLFFQQGKVDPFSLYLCLRESGDERVEAALDELMEQNKW